MKYLIIPILLLTACGVVKPYKTSLQDVQYTSLIRSSSSISSVSSVSSTSSEVTFDNLTQQNGDWWTKSNAIIVSSATGYVDFKLTRLPNEDSDFTSLGLYAMHISNDGVYTEVTDKRTLYIDSKFRNDNTRYIMADENDFNTLHKGTITKSYPIDCIPVALQGNSAAKECFNLKELLSTGKVVLGFLPSNNRVSFGVRFSDAVATPYKR